MPSDQPLFHDRRRHDRRDDDRNISERVAVMESVLRGHMLSCEKRGARLERLGWIVLTAVLSTSAVPIAGALQRVLFP